MSLIIPEVYANAITKNMKGRLKVTQLSKKLDLPAFKQVGETVVFPMFNAIGECEDVKKGIALKTEDLTQTSSTAKVINKGKAVRIYDVDDKTALGDFIENANMQQARVFAKELDRQLVVEALKTSLKVATGDVKAITADELNNGLALFGDEQDTEDFAGIVIHSLLINSMLNMQEFISASNTTVVSGNGIMRNGLLGFFRGIPVYVSDTAMDQNECTTLIIKKDSLAYMLKKDFNIEEEREAKLLATDIVANMMFAVKQINAEGVVVLRKTISK